MKKAGNALANILLLAFCLLYMFPIYIIFVNSFNDRAELYENVLALPKSFSPQYYAAAISKMNFLGAFKNTFVVTLVSVLISSPWLRGASSSVATGSRSRRVRSARHTGTGTGLPRDVAG